jgi:hypothetical protein
MNDTDTAIAALIEKYREAAKDQRRYAEDCRERIITEEGYAVDCERRAASFDALADRLATLETNQE